MKILKHIHKWFQKLLGTGLNLSTGIDSYKWESKVEILCHLSGGHH